MNTLKNKNEYVKKQKLILKNRSEYIKKKND